MSNQTGDTTASPLRLLIISPVQHEQTTPPPFPAFLQQLTGVLPPKDLITFAGYTSHPPLYIETKYFKSNVGLWCDELPESRTHPISHPTELTTATAKDVVAPPSEDTLAEWSEQMLSTTAREVRDVIGGIILLLPFAEQSLQSSSIQTQITKWLPYIETIAALRDAIEDESGRDIASVILLQNMTTSSSSTSGKSTTPEAIRDQMEDECIGVHGILGFDYVLWDTRTNHSTTQDTNEPTETDNNKPQQEPLNEYGEKLGFARLHEVLGGTDWTANPSTHNQYSDEDEDPDAKIEDIFNFSSTNKPDRNIPQIHTYKPDLHYPTSSPPQLTATETESNSLHGPEHAALQRELMGLKMAMLDIKREDSGPSSLAGEVDVGDLGMRTPLRPGASEKRDNDGQEEEGDEGQVEGLDGLVERVVAIREAASGLEGKEKERFARREVERIMRELG